MNFKVVKTFLIILCVMCSSCSTIGFSGNFYNDEQYIENDIKEEIIESAKSDIGFNGIKESDSLTEEQIRKIVYLNYLSVIAQEIGEEENKHDKINLYELYRIISSSDKDNLHADILVDLQSITKKIYENSKTIEYLNKEYSQYLAKQLFETLPSNLNTLLNNQDDLLGYSTATLDIFSNTFTSFIEQNQSVEIFKTVLSIEKEEKDELLKIQKDILKAINESVNKDRIISDYIIPEHEALEYLSYLDGEPNNRIISLERFIKEYPYVGDAWLELSKAYFEAGRYEESIKTFNEYNKIDFVIFKKDYKMAKVIPFVIKAIINKDELFDEDKEDLINSYIDLLNDNIDQSDWELRYVAALIYFELYGKTYNDIYLNKSFEILKPSTNLLVNKQKELNTIYLNNNIIVNNEDKKSYAYKEIDLINEQLKKDSSNKLPPIYFPLLLSSDLLRTIVNEKEELKNEYVGMLSNGDSLFLNSVLNNYMCFKDDKTNYDDVIINTKELNIPLNMVSEYSNIIVSVTSSQEKVVFADWKIKKIINNKEKIDDNYIVYSSKQFKKYKWGDGDKLRITIIFNKNEDIQANVNFKVIKEKIFLFKDNITMVIEE